MGHCQRRHGHARGMGIRQIEGIDDISEPIRLFQQRGNIGTLGRIQLAGYDELFRSQCLFQIAHDFVATRGGRSLR